MIAALVLATPAIAQDATDEEARDAAMDWSVVEDAPPETSLLELTGYVGALLPISVLASQGDTLQAELSTAPSFAAELDFWFAGSFGVAFMAGYAAPDVALTIADPETGMQSSEDIGSAKTIHGEALVRWRPQLMGSAASVLPYVGAGVGVRSLDFASGSVFDDETDVGLVLNLGTQVRLSDDLFLRVDVRDLITTFQGGPFDQSDTQHDIYAQVGVGFGL